METDVGANSEAARGGAPTARQRRNRGIFCENGFRPDAFRSDRREQSGQRRG